MRGVFTFILLFIVVGCSTHRNETSENISQIVDFKKTYALQDAELVDWDVMGIIDFIVCDSLFIYSKRDRHGCIGILDKQGHKQGDFLSIGNGPNELLFAPWINRASVYKLENCLYMDFLDQMKGINYKMNVTESINRNQVKMEITHDSIPGNSIFIPINEAMSFYCNANSDRTKRTRVVITSGDIAYPTHLQSLNDRTIEYGEDPNILSSIIKYSREKDLFVEISLMMNTIYLYDINGDFFKTLYIGKTLNKEEDIQRLDMGQRRLTFTNLRLYDDFWGVIYIDETLERYDNGKCKPSRILFFSWSGEPLADIALENQITSFDIDTQEGRLFTLDSREELLYRYNIRDILNDIESTKH